VVDAEAPAADGATEALPTVDDTRTEALPTADGDATIADPAVDAAPGADETVVETPTTEPADSAADAETGGSGPGWGTAAADAAGLGVAGAGHRADDTTAEEGGRHTLRDSAESAGESAADPTEVLPVQAGGESPADATTHFDSVAAGTAPVADATVEQTAGTDGDATVAGDVPADAADSGAGAAVAAGTAGAGALGVAGLAAAGSAPQPAEEPTEEPPFGPGSARSNPDGSAPGPEYTIKGNADSMLYHSPESPYYVRTRAEAWFDSTEAAEAAGFSPWFRRRSGAADGGAAARPPADEATKEGGPE
jgi:hypothetical protein